MTYKVEHFSNEEPVTSGVDTSSTINLPASVINITLSAPNSTSQFDTNATSSSDTLLTVPSALSIPSPSNQLILTLNTTTTPPISLSKPLMTI
jgi:hypothetical protein